MALTEVNSLGIKDGEVKTADIAADAITGAKIADDAIDSEHYTDGSIDAAHLSSDAVTGAKIADDAIDSEHYTDGSIDAVHLSDDAVSTAKIQNDAVTGAKIADDAVGAEHIERLDANLQLGDNIRVQFGADDDFSIRHDGTNCQITNTTGNLIIADATDTMYLQSDVGIRLTDVNGNENFLVANDNGSVDLYHDNSKKLATDSTGISVFGIEGGAAQIHIKADEGDDNPDIWRILAEPSGPELNFQSYNSGNYINNLRLTGDQGCELYYNNSVKLATTNAGGTLTGTWAGVGKVLQYVQTTDYTHVTLADNGDNYSQLNTSITPSAAASRVLIIVSLGLVSTDSAADMGWSLLRDTNGWLGVPSSTGATNEATFGAFMNEGSGWAVSSTMAFIDHPNTTSQVTYKVISRANSTRDMVINRRGSDNALRVSSFMQLLELA